MSQWRSRIFAAAIFLIAGYGIAAATAAPMAVITGIKVTGSGSEASIEISADQQLSYTYYKSPKPLRVVIEIARCEPGGVKPIVEVNEGVISRIVTEKKELSVFIATRITIELNNDVEVKVKSLNNRKKMVVAFVPPIAASGALAPTEEMASSKAPAPKSPVAAAPASGVSSDTGKMVSMQPPSQAAVKQEKVEPKRAPLPAVPTVPPTEKPAVPVAAPVAKPAADSAQPSVKKPEQPIQPKQDAGRRMVKNIRVNGDSVEIIGTGLETFKAFKLSDPGRLVIDIPGAGNALKVKAADLQVGPVQKCRIGESAGKVRIVFDYAKGAAVTYKIEKTQNGLRVTFPGKK